MALPKAVTRAEAKTWKANWQGRSDQDLPDVFSTAEIKRVFVYALYGDLLDAFLAPYTKYRVPRLRVHPASSSDPTIAAPLFHPLLELIDGEKVPNLQAAALYAPVPVDRVISVPETVPDTADGRILPEEAEKMVNIWRGFTAAKLPMVFTDSETQRPNKRLEFYSFTPAATQNILDGLQDRRFDTLYIYLGIKTAELMQKYQDDSRILFTFIVEPGNSVTGQLAAQQRSGGDGGGQYDFGRPCPEYCET